MNKIVNEKALAVLNKAIIKGLVCDGRKRPGIVIESMSQTDRETLGKLTSADTQQQRPDLLG